jgi:hypothetical protein
MHAPFARTLTEGTEHRERQAPIPPTGGRKVSFAASSSAYRRPDAAIIALGKKPKSP